MAPWDMAWDIDEPTFTSLTNSLPLEEPGLTTLAMCGLLSWHLDFGLNDTKVSSLPLSNAFLEIDPEVQNGKI
jgi:hypothetical protein